MLPELNNLYSFWVPLQFEPRWEQHLLESSLKQRRRQGALCLSEIMTIMVGFHLSGYQTFKHYYLNYVLRYQRDYFPGLVSYNRFVELLQGSLVPLCCFLTSRFGQCSGISFIDSTKISVCHNRRIGSHKVMADFAARGKTSVGWFYGFKLHLVINDQGELLGVKITAGNVDDRDVVPELARSLFGKLFGDRGYISQPLFEQLWEQGVQLVTKVRKNMKNKLLPMFDKLLLRKRSIIETVNDQLKNISQIEHSRHRSPVNFFVNLIAGLVAYTFREKKPSLNIRLPQALPDVVA
ncbi:MULTISPECIES: IS982 family transposase [Nitrosomonas]|nr:MULTISPECIES: IS982 family transposase [Nitrosomonas]UVS63476.1 IS982 family transposase [Nitrosomonas sp. PLL12]